MSFNRDIYPSTFRPIVLQFQGIKDATDTVEIAAVTRRVEEMLANRYREEDGNSRDYPIIHCGARLRGCLEYLGELALGLAEDGAKHELLVVTKRVKDAIRKAIGDVPPQQVRVATPVVDLTSRPRQSQGNHKVTKAEFDAETRRILELGDAGDVVTKVTPDIDFSDI